MPRPARDAQPRPGRGDRPRLRAPTRISRRRLRSRASRRVAADDESALAVAAASLPRSGGGSPADPRGAGGSRAPRREDPDRRRGFTDRLRPSPCAADVSGRRSTTEVRARSGRDTRVDGARPDGHPRPDRHARPRARRGGGRGRTAVPEPAVDRRIQAWIRTAATRGGAGDVDLDAARLPHAPARAPLSHAPGARRRCAASSGGRRRRLRFVLNTTALRAAGVTRASPDPPGGAIVQGRRRRADRPPAQRRRDARSLPARRSRRRRSTGSSASTSTISQTGITSVIERGATLEGYRAYEALHRAGRLHVRATVTVRIPRPDDRPRWSGSSALPSRSTAATTG